jgi:hypothetical protein
MPVNRPLRTALCAAALATGVGIAAFVPVIAAPPANQPAATPNRAQRDAMAPTDRFIVRFRDDALERRNPVARQHLLDNVGRKLGVAVRHGRGLANGADLIRTDRKLDAQAAKRLMVELKHDPRVAYVERDRVFRPMATPNDPLLPQQTYLLKNTSGIGADIAWNRGTGNGVVVAVLDSGSTPHPDLDANYVAGYDFISDIANANDGTGRDAGYGDPGDWNTTNACGDNSYYTPASTWHGTAVAGAIAAVGNNGVGLTGMAYKAKVMPVRVLGRCGGYTSDIADAITWAAGGAVAGVPTNTNPVEVINLSLSTYGLCSATLQSAIDTAHAAGIVVLGATPDVSVDTAGYAPANCNHVIGIGAARQNSSDPYYSTGDEIDLLAPAGYLPFGDPQQDSTEAPIQTTINTGTTAPGAAGYGTRTGPSMSTAIASGTVAVMQSIRPQAPAVVESLLHATGLGEQGGCSFFGHCATLIDADAATLALSTPVLTLNEWLFVDEGNAGTQNAAEFVVTLTEPLTTPVTFVARTVDDGATAGSDYVALAPTTFTIAPGQTSKTVAVQVIGDDVGESYSENFTLELSDVTGATPLLRVARAAIVEDDEQWLAPDHMQQLDPGRLAGGGARFTFDPPAGASNVTVTVASPYSPYGNDADLYVARDYLPTQSQYDCASENYGSNEACVLGTVSGPHHVLVITPNYFSGDVTLTVSWQQPTEISVGDAAVTEGASGSKTLTFTVTRTPVTLSSVSFDVATSDGTAVAGADYQAKTYTNRAFASGQATRTFTVPIYGDTTLEPNETFTVTLGNPVGATIVDGTATGTILNDEGSTLSVGDVTVNEGNAGTSIANVTVTLSQASVVPVTFTATTVDGSATAGSDYVAVTASKSIPAGQLSATFPVTLNGDTVNDDVEQFRVKLTASSVSATKAEGVVTIANDDVPNLSISDASVTEGNSGVRTATFVATLSRAASVPVSFAIRTAVGTATAGSDYREQWVDAVIPAGMLSKTFSVAILGDTGIEPNESLNALLSNAIGATITDGVGVGIILNDDGPTLSINDVAVVEGINPSVKLATFTVSLSQAAAGPVTYNINTTNGTASAPEWDYEARALTGETIPAGQLSRTFTVTIYGDQEAEANEAFFVNLTAVTGASVLDAQGQGTILNDDSPFVTITDASVAEGNVGTKLLTFTVKLSFPLGAPLSYDIATANANATAGVDYVAKALYGETIPAGQTSRTFQVQVNGDSTVEYNEAFYVNLTNVTGMPGLTVQDAQGSGVVLNDDGPTLSIGDIATVEGNSGTKTVTYTVTLSQPVAGPVTYNIATANGPGATGAQAGTDYVAKSLVGETIPAGMTSKTFTVTLNGDTTVEPNELVYVNLSNATGATLLDAQANVFVVNDDGPTLSIADAAVTEGNSGTSTLTFTVSLSQPSANYVFFNLATGNGSAVAGVDYVAASATGLTINNGALSKTFAVTINGDTAVEGNEQFTMTITGSSGATIADASAIGTITNDD